MKWIDRGRTHVILADRLIIEWSGKACNAAHPLLDDAHIRACTDGPDPKVLTFSGWALRCSLRPVDSGLGRSARLISVGTRPRGLPQLRRSRLTKRGRQIRRTLRAPSTQMGAVHNGYAAGPDR